MIQEQKTSEQLNEEYFKSLIATRASLNRLSMFIIGTVYGATFLGFFFAMSSAYVWNSPFDPFSVSLIIIVGFMFVWSAAITIPALRKKIYGRQDVAGIFQVIFIVFLTVELLLSMLLLASFRGGKYSFYSMSTTIVFILFVCAYGLSLAYNFFWLKKQLAVGFSERRTKSNFLSSSAVWSNESLAIIFSGTMLGRYLTAGQANVIGVVGGLFIAVVYARLNVEYAYVALLKMRDKSYWEEYNEADGLSKGTQKLLLRLAVEIALFVTIIYVGMRVLPQTHPLVPVMRISALGMVVYWGLQFIRWIRKNDTTNF